jgi:SAM-dependent methyltransferase
MASTWPKTPAALSDEDKRLNDDWQAYWFEINRDRYSGFVRFGHEFVVRESPDFTTTLEVGPGLGEHLKYEKLSETQTQNYHCLELRENMAQIFRQQWPDIQVSIADCQAAIPFADASFDRIVAIHLCEHLPNLPAFLREARRLLRKDTGRLLVVIPCEGGLGYSLARRITTKRIFEKRYHRPYEPFIRAEHPNQASEILAEMKALFEVERSQWWPLGIPSTHFSLCTGFSLKPRP